MVGFTEAQQKEVQNRITERRRDPGKVMVLPGKAESDRLQPKPDRALDEARRTAAIKIAGAAGVPWVLLDGSGDGAAQREAYRRLTRSTIEPLGRILAYEASMKLGMAVTVDFAALRGSDTAMQARAFASLTSEPNPLPQDVALYFAGFADER